MAVGRARPAGALRRALRPSCPLLLLAVAAAGCVHAPPSVYGRPGTSPAPQTQWNAPPQARRPSMAPEPVAAIPPDVLRQKLAEKPLGLAEIVDIALRTSTETRAAWAQARAAAAAYGSRRGSWLPDVNLGGSVDWAETAPSVGRPAVRSRTVGGTAEANWLLFNFGGRRAAIEETRAALIAADWLHNSVIQNVVLQVEQAYYQYVTTKALLASEEATLNEAQKNLDAAQSRHDAGLATIADVLQARTALSQVQLAVETFRGQIATTRGALATAMGLPANLPFDAEALPEQLPVPQVAAAVEDELKQAEAMRPDLAAARARFVAAQAHTRQIEAQGYPSFSASGAAGRFSQDRISNPYTTYSASVQVSFPLFTGFSHQYDVQQARAEADAARADWQTADQQVVLQVWTSYYSFRTAEARLRASEDLLSSATQSYAAVLGRYQSGVGSILDLVTSQAALESARAQQAQARSDWFVSLAQLAHDTGTLGPAPGGGGSERIPDGGAPGGGGGAGGGEDGSGGSQEEKKP